MVHLGDLVRKYMLIDLVNDLCEIGWPIELAVRNGSLVAVDNCRDTIDARGEDVSVQGEAVGATLSVRRDGATKTVKVDLLVAVVELKDVSDTVDSLHVLVAVGIHKVEGAWSLRVAI